jgi:hypothetical protein
MRRRWRWNDAVIWATVGATLAVACGVGLAYLFTVGLTWAFLGAWQWAAGAPLLGSGYNVWRLGLVMFGALILVQSGLRARAHAAVMPKEG